MLQIIRRNFALKILALALAIIGWAYFRFASNPLLAARFDQQLSVPIAAIGIRDGYVAHYAEKEAIVNVEPNRGAPPIKPDDIKAVLDLSGKGTGAYNVPVRLVAPSAIIQSLSPGSVTVTVEKIEQKGFPLAVNYVGRSREVVGSMSLMPGAAIVSGPASRLSQVTAVRVNVPLSAQATDLDEMVRPIPVDSHGREVGGLQVSPNLVRVQAHFIPGTSSQAR